MICPSCREPLDYPSGDGCAAMTLHKETKMTKRPETQSVESPKRPETLLKDLLMSESFDDLVAARLEMTLNWTMEDFDEVVGNLQYCRALVTVLEWFTVGDYDDITKKLNRIEDELKGEYY